MAGVRTCLLTTTVGTLILFGALPGSPAAAQDPVPLPPLDLSNLVGPPPGSAVPPAAVQPAPALPAPAQPAPARQQAPRAPAKAVPGQTGKSAPRSAIPLRSTSNSSAVRAPSFVRTGPASTARIVAALGPLVGSGMSAREAMILAGPPFPVAGMARYTDDFLMPRLGPIPHLHQGTDIFADFGTPIIASGAGSVTSRTSAAAGGLELWVSGDDGLDYYYAHLLSFSDTAKPGQRVVAGTVLGYVGNSGDAVRSPSHLHFEIHPPWSGRDKMLAAGVPVAGLTISSAGAVNPKPILDAWLAQAERHVEALVAATSAKPAGAPGPSDVTLANRVGNPAELIWFSVLQPALGSVGLVRQAVMAAAAGRAEDPAKAQAETQRQAQIKLAVRTPYIQLSELTHQPPDSPMDQLLELGAP